MKLSPTQQDVVLRMADGARLFRTHGKDPHCYWVGKRSDALGPCLSTLRALLIKLVIKRISGTWIKTKYILTDAGREEASRIQGKQEGK